MEGIIIAKMEEGRGDSAQCVENFIGSADHPGRRLSQRHSGLNQLIDAATAACRPRRGAKGGDSEAVRLQRLDLMSAMKDMRPRAHTTVPRREQYAIRPPLYGTRIATPPEYHRRAQTKHRDPGRAAAVILHSYDAVPCTWNQLCCRSNVGRSIDPHWSWELHLQKDLAIASAGHLTDAALSLCCTPSRSSSHPNRRGAEGVPAD